MDRRLKLLLANRDPVGAAGSLADQQAVARVLVARAAEAARQRYITPGDGKMIVYEAKRSEAAAWQAAVAGGATPDPADYPLLSARAERLDPAAPDYQAVADDWTARATAWMAAAAQIEDLYEAAGEAIDAATTAAEIRAALKIAWPAPV